MSKNAECVRVIMRCRPLTSEEKQDGRQTVVQVSQPRGEVTIMNPKTDRSEPPKNFTFDSVYDWTSTQEEIYKDTCFSIVDSVMEGYNGTIFAYGQTGTGKTFTMEGQSEPKALRGIIPRAFEQVFQQIEAIPDQEFLVRVSFLEIYNEEIRDLLAHNPKNRLDMREKPGVGFYVENLLSFPVQSVEEMHQKLAIGRKNRVVAETKMNKGSSRSHSVFTITVEASAIGPDGQQHIRMGKLNLVDLAGSEKQSKTEASGQNFVEAVNINLSLITLGNVISALVDPKATHIPYRDSKLTRLLKDSLGGNTKTVMIANIGPADWNFDETVNTLRYAYRAKNIKNKPKVNEDPKDAMLREFQDEIKQLKAQLEQFQGGAGPFVLGSGEERIVKVVDEEKIKEMEKKLEREKEEIRLKAEKERLEIEMQKNIVEGVKQKLLDDLKQKELEQQEAKEKQSVLLSKLKRMEEKVLIGTKAMEQAIEKEKEFQRIRKELEVKKARERQLEKDLEEQNILEKTKFDSIEKELEDKKKKLYRLYQKYQAAKSEIQDQQDEFNRERASYQEQISELNRQLMLKNLICDHFIPQEEAKQVELRAVWSEEIADWVLPNLHLSGNSLRPQRPGSSHGLIRPTSEYARMTKNLGNPDPRFRGDNVLDIPLEMPERTLEGFDGALSERMRKIRRIAFDEDDEDVTLMNLEGQPNVYYIYADDGIARDDGRGSRDRKKRLQSAGKKFGAVVNKKIESVSKGEAREVSEKDNFPKSKGLVTKTGFRASS